MFIMSINKTKKKIYLRIYYISNKSKIYSIYFKLFSRYTRELHKFRFNKLKKM